MRKAKLTAIHNGELWERLLQVVKVEEPVTFQSIRRWCPDVSLSELENALREMRQARRICVAREWTETRLIETYTYN